MEICTFGRSTEIGLLFLLKELKTRIEPKGSTFFVKKGLFQLVVTMLHPMVICKLHPFEVEFYQLECNLGFSQTKF